MVSAADGTDPVVVSTGRPVSGLVWAPDSRSLVLANNGTLSRVDAREGATPTVIAGPAPVEGYSRNVDAREAVPAAGRRAGRVPA